MSVDRTRTDPALTAFLTEFLGAWPPGDGITVAGSAARTRPGWDGLTRAVAGVGHPTGGVISVAPSNAEAVRAAVHTWDDVAEKLPIALGRPESPHTPAPSDGAPRPPTCRMRARGSMWPIPSYHRGCIPLAARYWWR